MKTQFFFLFFYFINSHFILFVDLILRHATSSDYKPSKQTYKGPEGETAVVDRVALCSDKNNNLCIKYMIRHTRRPEVSY